MHRNKKMLATKWKQRKNTKIVIGKMCNKYRREWVIDKRIRFFFLSSSLAIVANLKLETLEK